MGKASKQFAVEEALRNYLPVIADAGALIHCALPSLEDSLAREYRIESDIVEGLREVCHAHRWSQNEIIRHAIAAMGDQLGEPR